MDAVVAHGQASIEKGSKSFRTASKLFGPQMREDAWLLYAWCRRCDDEIDGQEYGFGATQMDLPERRRRLERLHRLTRAALAGQTMDDPDFAAFQRVALRRGLEPRWPLALLEGFAMDVDGRSYRTIDDTLEYCFGVAGVVGVMMGKIMGVKDPAVLRRAQDLGLAFQLTNIARDIYEDAAAGRVYLPADWLAEVGVAADPKAVRAPQNAAAVHTVALRVLKCADAYYASARRGLRGLPARAALAVAAARGVYREIGRIVARGGPAALQTRASASKPVMVWLLFRGVGLTAWSFLERLRPPEPRPPLWTKV
ncbi:phytoene/squalene synthase family protein [Phenylobacterium sp.]|jgi:phytoene synthase|uniref:phytoene/squalene synthase family protein n=1 Tax=Phenylobacterium sp. TaxID=1871053 RepID=UPI002E3178EF|nr:phytoene/squalene synthase family protein [Phenylobacterium sp.]HEX2558861.1 phytoene/squalene synthase family protein [Phenylobacterium sp.]